MPSKDAKTAKAANAGSTSKRNGKTPAPGSRAATNQTTANRNDQNRRQGNPAGINWN